MQIAIVKYNAGNIYSVVHGLKRIGVEAEVTDDIERLRQADGVLFPGQGEAATTMSYLKAHGLDQVIKGLRQPVLGICVGMQLMCAHSEEGDVDCLGIFDVPVRRFVQTAHEPKIPHMGSDQLTDIKSPLFKGLAEGCYVYFIHSYYVERNPYSIAQNDYIQPYCAAMARDNFYATQFHPEKSGRVGEQILSNFLDIVRQNQ